ncbi:ADP-ribose pyrophosphatase YjhB, NUDIX family [Oceanobacillus limi]|uniref:ADP-ribose pyrophosphatase YjhB, NUDIX family n=1 Tax=Oceanobacillus limi TaxID=930131 RepID=A0A1I0CG87_9BACI|nr:NUDIX domain-containing protein [Oceanobacillus limi]SET18364.1 ADP-ribose pyrophosphatase YjhB, NUDIX family [Oceanobacillus limi]
MFIVNVEGAIYHKGKWLLIKRSEKEEHAAGALSLVGGKVDPSEGTSSNILERTLIREIFEEVGIKVKVRSYVNSSSFISDSGKHVVDIVFLCDYESGDAFAKSPDEVDEVVWMTSEEITNDTMLAGYLRENMKLAEEIEKATHE